MPKHILIPKNIMEKGILQERIGVSLKEIQKKSHSHELLGLQKEQQRLIGWEDQLRIEIEKEAKKRRPANPMTMENMTEIETVLFKGMKEVRARHEEVIEGIKQVREEQKRA